MPIYALSDELIFPPPDWAAPEGILAIGGDLRPERLLLAYQQGIFPWYSPGEPIVWWSPDPRFVLMLEELKISKSMKQVMRSGKFHFTADADFQGVIQNCKTAKRRGQGGTWITQEMQQAYIQLHRMGYAHSVEVWQQDELAGGLYGVSLGNTFFGESMFTRVSNASKAGFIWLLQQLATKGFEWIDCQVYTAHLQRFGARNIPRSRFLKMLEEALTQPTHKGNWGNWLAEEGED